MMMMMARRGGAILGSAPLAPAPLLTCQCRPQLLQQEGHGRHAARSRLRRLPRLAAAAAACASDSSCGGGGGCGAGAAAVCPPGGGSSASAAASRGCGRRGSSSRRSSRGRLQRPVRQHGHGRLHALHAGKWEVGQTMGLRKQGGHAWVSDGCWVTGDGCMCARLSRGEGESGVWRRVMPYMCVQKSRLIGRGSTGLVACPPRVLPRTPLGSALCMGHACRCLTPRLAPPWTSPPPSRPQAPAPARTCSAPQQAPSARCSAGTATSGGAPRAAPRTSGRLVRAL